MEPVGEACSDAFEEPGTGRVGLHGFNRLDGGCVVGFELGVELDFDEFFDGLFDEFPPLWPLGCCISLSFSSSSLHSSTAAAALFRLIIGLVHVRPKITVVR